MFLESFGTEHVDPARIRAAIVRDLDLLRQIYAPTAAYGYVGRTGVTQLGVDPTARPR